MYLKSHNGYKMISFVPQQYKTLIYFYVSVFYTDNPYIKKKVFIFLD